MHPCSKVVLGIAGNIGTGKTTAAMMFKELGATYISADEVGWEVLPEISQVLRKKFGEQIMRGSEVDKRKLREIVFGDRRKLDFLNRVSHPLLVNKIAERVKLVKSGVAVIDAALLFDWPKICGLTDYLVLVTAHRDTMMARAKSKGIDGNTFSMILSMQRDSDELSAQADFVINNNGTLAELRRKCKKLYQRIKDDC
jgi:dephospho-CoA kinase